MLTIYVSGLMSLNSLPVSEALCLLQMTHMIWALTRITSRGFANNTCADQPAHPRSLISTFVIRFLESIICKLATSEISIF